MFPPLPLAGDSVTFGEKIPLPISGEVILTVTKSPGWQLEGGRGQVLAWMSRGDMMTAKDTSRFISTLQEAHGPQRSVAFRCPLARTLAVVALSFNNHRYSNREFFSVRIRTDQCDAMGSYSEFHRPRTLPTNSRFAVALRTSDRAEVFSI